MSRCTSTLAMKICFSATWCALFYLLVLKSALVRFSNGASLRLTSQPQASTIKFFDSHQKEDSISEKDVFIAVKTTTKYHKSRLPVILDTWFPIAKEMTYFFTDSDDSALIKTTDGHVINTGCTSGHDRTSLCCKMASELEEFVASGRKFFCHVDDDNYVNLPRLFQLLNKYNPDEDHYLGRPSLSHPLEIKSRNSGKQLATWFATGGAGMCLTRALVLKMLPFTSNGQFVRQCNSIRLPDDVVVGYIVEHLVGGRLEVIEDFHSHLGSLVTLDTDDLPNMITFSYSISNGFHNVINVPGFPEQEDPTRFLSAHCKLFPYLTKCNRIARPVA